MATNEGTREDSSLSPEFYENPEPWNQQMPLVLIRLLKESRHPGFRMSYYGLMIPKFHSVREEVILEIWPQEDIPMLSSVKGLGKILLSLGTEQVIISLKGTGKTQFGY